MKGHGPWSCRLSTSSGTPRPILSRAALTKFIQCPDANQRFHFFRQRLHADEEIGQRNKSRPRAFRLDRFFCALSQAFDQEHRNANGC